MPIKNLRILLVDDDEFMLTLMSAGLDGLGVSDVVTATNGMQALALLEADGRFDAIFTDLNMPEMDGIELMRHLAESRYRGGIVLLTGEHPKVLQTADRLAKAHNLHLVGVLQKPFLPDTLKAVLEKVQATKVDEEKSITPEASPEVSADELATAIAEGQIIPWYQPQIRISDRQVVGMEALARWQHPRNGMVMPGVFIPLAERSGLIKALSQHMLKAAIGQLGEWRTQGFDFKLSVNVTAEDVLDVGLPDQLAEWCRDADIPASSVVLEITEGQLMRNTRLALDTLIRLRLKGLSLAIDDFGTGYSNLRQIKRAPFGELKIDRSLVTEGVVDDEGRAILQASIQLGRQLGLTVVAEGVETQAQWDAVSRYGADEVQGYLAAAPMPARDLPAWLAGWYQQSEDRTA